MVKVPMREHHGINLSKGDSHVSAVAFDGVRIWTPIEEDGIFFLADFCRDQLAVAEEKVKTLLKDGDGFAVESGLRDSSGNEIS